MAHRKGITTHAIWLGCFSTLILSSCYGSKTQQYSNIITSQELNKKIAICDTTIILFYTDWCAGKKIIDDVYDEYINQIREKKLNTQIILIASDNNITDSVIEARTEKQGYNSFRIDAGYNPISNRNSIRKFINSVFPNNKLIELKKIGYAIPVELWVTKEKKILNEDDLSNTSAYSDKLMNRKTIEIRIE